MSEHEPEVGPVVKVARDLTEIVTMAGELAAQAVDSSSDRLMPGGKATVSLAHVASLEAWEHRYEAAERLGRDTSYVQDEDDSWEPPLQTLLFWSEDWRREHGAEYGMRPTIGSEAGFLRWCLNWAWDNEPRFEDFARDIRRARIRLEDVVHDGRRVERTRVPCTNETCERKPRLIKVYGYRAAEDGYKCPSCRTRYDQSAFARAKLRLLHDEEGADRHVKMQDARDASDIPERTFRHWVRFWHIRSYRDLATGQVWVWWPDVREKLVTPDQASA